MLAPYASMPLKGRLKNETESSSQLSPFEEDKERIIQSNAFRRLEYKTQVFVNYAGDHYRTRLTHSIEVANIARQIATKLSLNADLAECVALAHDMGHPPFGHCGEDALNEVMQNYGGFAHNVHTLKLLVSIEQRHAAFDGLNLTWESLEAIVKHNGPITSNVHPLFAEYDKTFGLDIGNYTSAEGQIAAIADDIAYHNHDMEDGIRAGLLTIEDLYQIDFIRDKIYQIQKDYPGIKPHRLIYEFIKFFKTFLINDLIENTSNNIKNLGIESVDDIRKLNQPLVTFTNDVDNINSAVKKFLYEKVYYHHKVIIMKLKAQRIIKGLFGLYMENIQFLPEEWQSLVHDEQSKARVISDYIAGMTDRYAFKEYDQFFNLNFFRY